MIVDYGQMTERIVEATKDLPQNEDESVHVGCKKSKDVVPFFNRTAGILAMVKPCGIIADLCEMYTCESPSQIFAFLYHICDNH